MRDMIPIFIFVSFAISAITYSIGFSIGVSVAEEKYQYEAAQTSCAHFNSTTRQFEWIDDIERMIKEYE